MRIEDVVSEEAADLSGALQGSIIEPPSLPYDLPDGLQLSSELFADDTKMVDKSVGVDLIVRGLVKTATWADRNTMLLNAVKSQYLHFGPNPPPTLSFPDSSGSTIPLPHVHCTNDFGVLAGCSLSPSA